MAKIVEMKRNTKTPADSSESLSGAKNHQRIDQSLIWRLGKFKITKMTNIVEMNRNAKNLRRIAQSHSLVLKSPAESSE